MHEILSISLLKSPVKSLVRKDFEYRKNLRLNSCETGSLQRLYCRPVPLKLLRFCLLPLVLAACLRASGQDALVPLYHLWDFSGNWKLVTNIDSTVTAMEYGVHRDGNKVYSRVLVLKPVTVQAGVSLGTESTIANFISQYHPPHVAYTSPAKAAETGEQKFDCLEFAEDIVSQAVSNGISAEVIGIKLQGKLTGHACAGFPTADGQMLYFDSTPGAGKFSHGAHQAAVEIGQPYRRSDGGELGGGVGRLPIEKIIPVTPLQQTSSHTVPVALPVQLSPATTFTVQNEEQTQARGILYAEENSLEVAAAQLNRWQAAIDAQNTAQAKQNAAELAFANTASGKNALRALRNNEEMAAQGDAYAEMRMGERYRDGDGVPKDFAKARAYLGMAAAHGSTTADKELTRLENASATLAETQ